MFASTIGAVMRVRNDSARTNKVAKLQAQLDVFRAVRDKIPLLVEALRPLYWVTMVIQSEDDTLSQLLHHSQSMELLLQVCSSFK